MKAKKSTPDGDFSEETKLILAKQAGEKCSLCGNGTSISNTELNNFTNLGEAAHIKGNKKGKFNRYDELMSNEERSDIKNGIWLCRTCHKKIDSDDSKYTVDYLRSKKTEHIQRIIDGYYNQKYPDFEGQEIIKHDKSIYIESENILNELNLQSFLNNLKKERFVYWDDENLKKVNDFIDFHNLVGKKYLTKALNESYEKLLNSINILLLTLYSVEEKDKKMTSIMDNPYLDNFFIGMQTPLDFNYQLILNVRYFMNYNRKFKSYSTLLDKCIEDVNSQYNEYRIIIKKKIYT